MSTQIDVPALDLSVTVTSRGSIDIHYDLDANAYYETAALRFRHDASHTYVDLVGTRSELLALRDLIDETVRGWTG